MCSPACIQFAERALRREEVAGAAVIEVGAVDVNGSVRSFVTSLSPSRYLGVDLAQGPGVDEICDASSLVARYGEKSFDVVISTEMLEHVREWRAVVSNMKRLLKPGGVLLLTTRSQGFPYHGYPYDFWRYSLDDMRVIFGDLEIEALEIDPLEPGVFIKARRSSGFVERSLSSHALFSMITRERTLDVSDRTVALFNLEQNVRHRFLVARSVVWQRLLRSLPPGVASTLRNARERFRAGPP
ncbi:MAG TPA: methyltransferase domain-containing protein [Polyangiaceae bacterium]|nr:methyltransferase domain-containing protein [Polyangiaceae bacterium]